MRILLASLLTLAALAATAPSASATCLDTTPDDDGVGTNGCNLPAGGDCRVLVYGELPGISSGCSPIACVRECVPLFPPYDCVQDCDGPATSAQELPCGASADALAGTVQATCAAAMCEAGPVVTGYEYERTLHCDTGIRCVTEPCPSRFEL